MILVFLNIVFVNHNIEPKQFVAFQNILLFIFVHKIICIYLFVSDYNNKYKFIRFMSGINYKIAMDSIPFIRLIIIIWCGIVVIYILSL